MNDAPIPTSWIAKGPDVSAILEALKELGYWMQALLVVDSGDQAAYDSFLKDDGNWPLPLMWLTPWHPFDRPCPRMVAPPELMMAFPGFKYLVSIESGVRTEWTTRMLWRIGDVLGDRRLLGEDIDNLAIEMLKVLNWMTRLWRPLPFSGEGDHWPDLADIQNTRSQLATLETWFCCFYFKFSDRFASPGHADSSPLFAPSTPPNPHKTPVEQGAKALSWQEMLECLENKKGDHAELFKILADREDVPLEELAPRWGGKVEEGTARKAIYRLSAVLKESNFWCHYKVRPRPVPRVVRVRNNDSPKTGQDDSGQF